MNKDQYLRKLEYLLSDLPEEERREAMEYYVEYFEEAGPEREAEVIRELGTPETVAETIHKELADKGIVPYRVEKKQKKERNGWQIAFIVLVCVLVSPVVIPLAIALFAVVIAVLACVVALIVSAVVLVVSIVAAFLVAAILLFVVGISNMGLPLVGLMMIGSSFLCAGLFLLCGWGLIKLCAVVVPEVIKGCIHLIGMPFRGKEAHKA